MWLTRFSFNWKNVNHNCAVLLGGLLCCLLNVCRPKLACWCHGDIVFFGRFYGASPVNPHAYSFTTMSLGSMGCHALLYVGGRPQIRNISRHEPTVSDFCPNMTWWWYWKWLNASKEHHCNLLVVLYKVTPEAEIFNNRSNNGRAEGKLR